MLDACSQISDHHNYTKAAHAKGDVQIGGDLISVPKLNDYLSAASRAVDGPDRALEVLEVRAPLHRRR